MSNPLTTASIRMLPMRSMQELLSREEAVEMAYLVKIEHLTAGRLSFVLGDVESEPPPPREKHVCGEASMKLPWSSSRATKGSSNKPNPERRLSCID